MPCVSMPRMSEYRIARQQIPMLLARIPQARKTAAVWRSSRSARNAVVFS